MQSKKIEKYIIETFKNVNVINTWGEKSFFFNPNQQFKRGTYFTTLKEKDGENDKASFLDRENVFRLNIGITKEYYSSLFSLPPKRPAKGEVILENYDFQKLDIILPHPVYGWMSWVCILNPSDKSFEKCKSLLEDAYNKAKILTEKKLKKLKN